MSLPWALACAALVGASLIVGSLVGRPAPPAAPRVPGALGAVAVGVLLFVLWDVLTEAFLPLDGAVEQWIDGLASARPVEPLAIAFFVGLVVGFAGPAAADGWWARVAQADRPRREAMGSMVTKSARAGSAGAPTRHPQDALATAGAVSGGRFWPLAAAWGGRGALAGLVLGSASSSEDLALSVLLSIGLALAYGPRGARQLAEGERALGRWRWPLGGCPVALAVIGVLVGRVFPNDGSAVRTLAISVGIWAAGTGTLAYLITALLPELAPVIKRWVLYAGVLLGLGLSFGVNLLLMVASETA